MGRIRIDIEVESIDLSILCHEDCSIDSIQVYAGRRMVGGVSREFYKDVEWMFTDEALRRIDDALAEKIRDMAEDFED
jgi:hypothetical protein